MQNLASDQKLPSIQIKWKIWVIREKKKIITNRPRNERDGRVIVTSCFILLAALGCCCAGFLPAVSGGHPRSGRADFSLWWLLVAEHRPQAARASVVACGEHRLTSCNAQAQLLCNMGDLPEPGIEPVTPTLAGAFFTIEPQGKSSANLCLHAFTNFLLSICFSHLMH